MSIKKFVAGVALATTVLLAMPTLADGGRQCRKGMRNPDQIVQRMQKNLDLTDQQAVQVKEIFAAHKTDFEQLREQMKNTFTDQQRDAMKEMRKKRRAERGDRTGPPSAEEREQALRDIGISDGQIQQMKSLKEQMKAERNEIKQELAAVFTPEQQQKLEEMKSQRKHRRGGKHRQNK